MKNSKSNNQFPMPYVEPCPFCKSIEGYFIKEEELQNDNIYYCETCEKQIDDNVSNYDYLKIILTF